MNTRALVRIGIMFAWIPLAFVVGLATHSQGAFVAVMAMGLCAGVVLRLVWR